MDKLQKVVFKEFVSGYAETSVISVGKIIPRQLILKHKPIATGTSYNVLIKRDMATAYEATPILVSDIEDNTKEIYNFPDGLTYTFLQFKLDTAIDVSPDEPELVFIYQDCDLEGQARQSNAPAQNFDVTGVINPTIITGGFVPRGEYDNTHNYSVGDSVSYNGSSYILYADASAGTLPTDTDYWQEIAAKGDPGLTVSVNTIPQVAGNITITPDNLSDSATTNKFTTAEEKTKLANIESGAEVNNISDANAIDLTDGGATTLHKHSYTNLDNKPTIPDELADLTADSTHRTVTDAEKTTWNAKQAALTEGTDYLNKTHLDAAYEPKNANIQSHISNSSNPHTVTKAQIGLGNCDDTTDLNKPVSTATQTAINAIEKPPYITVGFEKADYICDGTDDDIQIQAAIDALGTSGGTIYLKKGTYNIGNTISIAQHNISLLGSGIRATILKLHNSKNKTVLSINKSNQAINYIEVGRMSIDGNRANNTSGRGLELYGGWRCNLHDLQILETAGKGLNLIGTSTYKGLLNTLYNIYIYRAGLEGLNIEYQYDSYYHNIYIEASGNEGILEQNATSNVYIRCHCYNSGQHGIRLTSAQYSSLIHCLGETSQKAGIKISGSRCNISNCAAFNNSKSGANTYSGIEIVGTYNKITSAFCYDSQATRTQKYGIEETGAANYNIYAFNDCTQNNLTGKLNITGANSIQDNNY
jgi:hypothetical protein